MEKAREFMSARERVGDGEVASNTEAELGCLAGCRLTPEDRRQASLAVDRLSRLVSALLMLSRAAKLSHEVDRPALLLISQSNDRRQLGGEEGFLGCGEEPQQLALRNARKYGAVATVFAASVQKTSLGIRHSSRRSMELVMSCVGLRCAAAVVQHRRHRCEENSTC